MPSRRRFAIAVCSALLLAAGIPDASAASIDPCGFGVDTTPPAIGSISVSPTEVVVGRVRQSASVTLSASDACGIDATYMSLTYAVVGDVSAGSISFDDFELISGSAQSGVWQASEVLSDYAQGGEYEATEASINDSGYNGKPILYPTAPRLRIKQVTAVSLDTPSQIVVQAGRSSVLTGFLDLPSRAKAGPMELQTMSSTGSWARAAAVPYTPDTSYGSYTIAVRPVRTTSYRIAYLGDGATAPSVSRVLRVQATQAITVKPVAARVARGTSVTVTGQARPVVAGQKVALQRQAGSRWVTIGTVRVASTGSYRVIGRLTAGGTTILRVFMGADRERLAGASRLVRVQVT